MRLLLLSLLIANYLQLRIWLETGGKKCRNILDNNDRFCGTSFIHVKNAFETYLK